MKYVQTFLALLLLAAAVFAVRYFTDEKTAIIAGGMVIVTLLALSVIMFDDHAIWLVRARNIPVWGQFVAAIVVLATIGPVLVSALWNAAQEFFGAFQGTQCLVGGGALVVFIVFVLLDRMRRQRRRTNRHTPQPPNPATPAGT